MAKARLFPSSGTYSLGMSVVLLRKIAKKYAKTSTSKTRITDRQLIANKHLERKIPSNLLPEHKYRRRSNNTISKRQN